LRDPAERQGTSARASLRAPPASHILVRPALLIPEHNLIRIGSGFGSVRSPVTSRTKTSPKLPREGHECWIAFQPATGSELRGWATSPRRSCIIARGTAPLPRYAPARYPPVDHRACARGGLAIEMHRSAIPRHPEMAERYRRLLVDQGMSNLSIVNWRPSQKRNARLIDAISAPSRPHSSFVGSRCCCRAETSRSRAAVKSAMTISFRSSAKSPRVRANHGVSVNVVLPPNHWFGAKPCRAEFRAHRRGRAINPSR